MRRVLFVDDELRILEGLRRMLRPQRHEWEMAFAPSGEAALAMMEASPFDVIVSDMRMPGMDGAKLLATVRELYPQVVRVVLSNHTELSTALRVVPVAHQFLAKPCDAGTLRVAIERACHLKGLLSDEAIRRTVGALRDLPSLPRTCDALTQALSNPNTSLQKLARIIEQDVGISAKILQLVNSAFFGIAQSITNIEHAVIYLGINTLRSLVLSLEIFRVFKPKRAAAGILLGGAARPCTARCPYRCSAAGSKTPYGHRCRGRYAARRGKADPGLETPRAVSKAAGGSGGGGLPAYKVEEREYGFTHAEIGAYLLGLWGLPYILVEAVALHHGPNQVPHQHFDAVLAVHAANLLAHELEVSSPGVTMQNHTKASQAELTALVAEDDLAAWRAMASEIPVRLAEA